MRIDLKFGLGWRKDHMMLITILESQIQKKPQFVKVSGNQSTGLSDLPNPVNQKSVVSKF